MDMRQKQLADLRLYIQDAETEVTMILQSLQWDRKGLLANDSLVTCKYDANHRIPIQSKEEHENQCRIQHLGYSREDILLPDPPDPKAKTLVTFSKHDIQQIINAAPNTDVPLTKEQGTGCEGTEPLTLGRLQTVYSPDERRAIYDAVVSAVPSCHDLADLALPSSNGEGSKASATKSRVEVLAELRNMKRRRTKYRVAAKTNNYSDVLRDVIKTQMEMCTKVSGVSLTENPTEDFNIQNKLDSTKNNSNTFKEYKQEEHRNKHKHDNEYSRDKHKRDHKDTPEIHRKDKRDRFETKEYMDREKKEKRHTHREKEKHEDRRRYDEDKIKKHDIEDKYGHSSTYKDDTKYHESNRKRKSERDSYSSSYENRSPTRNNKQYDKRDRKHFRYNDSFKADKHRRYYDDYKDKSYYREKKRSNDK
ncbi:U11/U12 small nuclear ribonucleoprotein 48 kDa protein [Aphomia sociella]